MKQTDLIAMQENLGLGHKGNILITTQERIDKNLPAIAQNIIDEEFAHFICNHMNAYDTLKANRDKLKAFTERMARHCIDGSLIKHSEIADIAEQVLKEAKIKCG